MAYFYVIWALNFELITCYWIKTLIVVEKVLMCIMAIIDFRKSIIHMTLKICTFDPLLNTIIYAK